MKGIIRAAPSGNELAAGVYECTGANAGCASRERRVNEPIGPAVVYHVSGFSHLRMG